MTIVPFSQSIENGKNKVLKENTIEHTIHVV